jgi:hypothetical protein
LGIAELTAWHYLSVHGSPKKAFTLTDGAMLNHNATELASAVKLADPLTSESERRTTPTLLGWAKPRSSRQVAAGPR